MPMSRLDILFVVTISSKPHLTERYIHIAVDSLLKYPDRISLNLGHWYTNIKLYIYVLTSKKNWLISIIYTVNNIWYISHIGALNPGGTFRVWFRNPFQKQQSFSVDFGNPYKITKMSVLAKGQQSSFSIISCQGIHWIEVKISSVEG